MDFYISEKFQKELDKGYLDFLVGLYISSSKNPLRGDEGREQIMWFLQEILQQVQTIWPNLSKDQYQDIMNSIVDIANTSRNVDEERVGK